MTQRSFDTWQQTIEELTALYRGIDRRSLGLATISLSPLFADVRGVVRFAVSPVCDAVRLAAASIQWGRTRNWQYSCSTSVFLRAMWHWIWRGEAPLPPLVVQRALVSFILARHFQSRLSILRRGVLLEDGIDAQQRTELLAAVDESLAIWRQPKVTTLLSGLTGLVSSGVVALAFGALRGSMKDLSNQTTVAVLWWAGATVVCYLVTFGYSALLTKRGLMLGATSQMAPFPGLVADRGRYEREHALLASVDLGTALREPPIDLFLALLATLLPALFVNLGSFTGPLWTLGLLLAFILSALAIWRRGRCRRQ